MMVERLLPRLDTGVVRQEHASELLISAVSATLNTPRDDIQLFDSFIDLGGDQKSADALHQICRTKGIEVKLDDIMSCQTLAELQTRVTPWPLRGTPVTVQSMESSPARSEGYADQSVPSSTTDDVFSPTNHHRLSRHSAQTAYSASSYGSVPSDFSLTQNHPIARSAGQDLESLLKSSPRVSNVCLVTPRAGFFDGQLVALVKVSSLRSQLPEQSSPDEIALPPRSHHSTQKQEVRSLRMAVQEWGADSRRPQVWIPLRAMAELDGGRPDTRALQTWVQNLSEADYEDIMKLQIPEPRNGTHDFMSRRQQVQSWAESRRSAWADDDAADDLDDMECYPLAPMQQLFFTTSMGHSRDLTIPQTIAGPGLRYSQSITLRILGGAEDSDIDAAVEAMVARHGMLRARFRPVHDHWVQIIMPDAADSYTLSHHTNVDDEEMASLMDQSQAAINPTTGPVFDVKHTKNGNEHLLYLVAHQLVVDAISWRIIVHDLDELLRDGSLLSEGSIPFPHWVDYQNYETSQRLFEPTLPFAVTPADLSYWGLEKDPNCFSSAQKRSFTLPAELLSILQKACPEVLRTEATDVFLASLLLSFVQTFSDRQLPTLWKQEHGRDVMHKDFNIMETVGWFNSLCPIGASVEPSTTLIQAIKMIKDTRRAIPRDGIPFFTSEVSNSNGSSAGIPVEISFNWIDNQGVSHENGILEPVQVPGQLGQVLRSDVGPLVGRIALFEISVLIDGSGALVDFSFNKNSKCQRKIEMWIRGFESLLLEAVSTMRFYEPELTLSDVPLLRTTYNALTKLGSDRLSGAGLPRVKDIETIYPITPTQQEILMAQSQNMYSYHVHGVYELGTSDGTPVDPTRLCKAWETIVANKPALRSIFIDGVSRDGLFDRVVLKKISPNMLFIESSDPAQALSNLPPLKTPLTDPRHRLTMCHTSSTTMVRVDASQAICDLTSVHHLIAELCKVYAGEEPVHNEALHRTYLYHISSLDTSFSLEVWKIALANVRPCFFPRLTPAVDEVMPHPFDLEVTRDQLMNFCKSSGVHPAAVLQLAWAIVLRVFIGVDNVVFGYQYAGRDEELLHGIGQAVGSFANVLPCAMELAPGQAIRDALERANEAFAASTKHQSLTMAEIQHAMRFEENELFNTCLLFQDSGIFPGNDEVPADQNAANLRSKNVTSSRRTHCDVSLTTTFINDQLHANLSSRFLSDLQTKSIVHSFEAAVKNIIDQSASLIADVDMFTDRDYASLVVRDWELAQKSNKVSACLHDVILRHGQTHPNAPAIHSWDGDMSYIQFATLVAKLRTYLVNLGVGPGKVIPVVLEKNRWAPVMLLAVMQAGASFVALDCQDQVTVKSTIAYLVPPIVLAAEAAWRELGGVVLNLVIINDAFFAMLPPRMSYLSPEASPDHAACAFVTPKRSSNGASRSIFFTHASLCSAFAAQGPALRMNNDSRVLQLSAFNVDISLVEILGTLFHGGCICIPSAADRANNLQGVIDQMHVTWTYMTSVLARKIDPLQVPLLKTIVFRTRKLDQDTYGPWLENRNVLLAYGAPDVCPLGISISEVNRERALNIIPPPISGRFWILNPDDSHKLMPLGSIGELAIDSPLVTPHRFDPELPLVTQRPLSSGSSDKHKNRYLRTGHRVRHLDDGSIEFISSANDEIIVNGQTVDVAEVEQRIRRCLGPGVDVTVDKIRTKDSVRTLAAFLELGDSLFHGKEDLDKVSQRVKERAFIAKKLFEASLESPGPGNPKIPDHCIPAVYIPLKSFPISTSLKINRRKLLRTAASFRFSELVDMSTVHNPHEIQRVVLGQKPLPLTRPEEVMRAIWARVLGISPLDIKGTSSFLAVGGNKFLATELVVACRKVGIRVSLVSVFNGATLTEISRSAASPVLAKKDLEKHSRVRSRKKSFDYKFVKEVIAPKMDCSVTDIIDIAEASSDQIRNLELGMYTPRGDISCLAIKFNGRVSPEKLESACEAIVKLHPILRTAFVTHEHQVYQVMCSSFRPTFEKAYCITHQLEEETERLIRVEQNIPFKPSVPVTGFTFLDAADQGTLIIRLGKAQFDDASVSVIVQDLISSYEGTRGSATACSFYQYMRGARHNYSNVIGYWAVQMKDARMTEMVAHSKPCRPTSRTRTLKQTAKISSFINHGITPDTMMKAAWAMVLATLSGQDDVLFGEVVHGHNIPLPADTDLTNMVGPLTNTIPVRVRFPAVRSAPIDLMKCIQRQRQSNYRFEAVGIDDMRRHVCAEWPSWARYSTVVHHRSSAHMDGSATYNMGGTTFTYQCVDPAVRDLPDMLVTSMMESAERVKLEIQFPEDRVDEALAHDCMRLLIGAMVTLTHPDTLGQPMLQSADEIQRTERRIPLVPEQPPQHFRVPVNHLLLPEQRAEIEGAITETWNRVMNMTTQHLSEDRMHYTPFYTRGSSLLSAQPLADALNQKLSKLALKGIETVVFTPEDVIDNPTMASQLDIVAKRLREGGSLSLPLPANKKSSNNYNNNHLLLKPDTTPRFGNNDNSNNNNTNTNANTVGSTKRPKSSGNTAPTALKWRNSILRGRDSLRSLSIRPPAWKRSKDAAARPSSPLPPTDESPVLHSIPPLAGPVPHIHVAEVAEMLDVESISRLMSAYPSDGSPAAAAELPSSNSAVSGRPVVDTLFEEKIPVTDEYLVSPLSPEPTDVRLSMWGALYESARSLTPLGFQIASK